MPNPVPFALLGGGLVLAAAGHTLAATVVAAFVIGCTLFNIVTTP